MYELSYIPHEGKGGGGGGYIGENTCGKMRLYGKTFIKLLLKLGHLFNQDTLCYQNMLRLKLTEGVGCTLSRDKMVLRGCMSLIERFQVHMKHVDIIIITGVPL